MAWQTPSTVSTGDILEAATWNQAVVANSLMGQPVFTNEAARDAAIPSPTEGQACYLTAPTIPAATGSITAVPSGVQTVYNGSVWVCVTEVGARSETTGTTTSTSFVSTLTGDATAISVTLVTGTTALVNIGFTGYTSGATMYAAVAVSGASTIAASISKAAFKQDLSSPAANISSHQATFVFPGLTAGTNTFTLQYRSSAAVQIAFDTGARNLVVKGIA